MESNKLTAEQVERELELFYSKKDRNGKGAGYCLRLIKLYVSQEKEDMIAQRDKALDERDNARIWVKSLQRERNKAAELLLSAYRLVCRANEFMYTDGTGISDATSRDLYHFVLNDGPEIEDLLLQQGLITKDQKSDQ